MPPYLIKQIKDQHQFNNLVGGFSTLHYESFNTAFENISDGENGAIALVVMMDREAIAYIIADDCGCHFIETREDKQRQGLATRLLKRTKSIFVNNVCSEACKEMCERLDLDYDEVSKR